MNYLVAVSGGVDSVVLLHRLVTVGQHKLIVAHFDHGIRPDSADDVRFVESLAASYNLPFVTAREELGLSASEEKARHFRYLFLRQAAKRYNATIVTAHHADDVIETIAINLRRGTGWRGMAVLDTPTIVRPLLVMTKQQIREYALRFRLEWVEDSTNASDRYLRNRVRSQIQQHLSPSEKEKLFSDWRQQLELKQHIDAEIALFTQADEYSRYFMTHIDDRVAVELLRAIIVRRARHSVTRPQLARALLAVKAARPGSVSEIGGKIRLRFTVSTFIVETP